MNDILRIARLRIALQRAFLGRAILRVIRSDAGNLCVGVVAKLKVSISTRQAAVLSLKSALWIWWIFFALPNQCSGGQMKF